MEERRFIRLFLLIPSLIVLYFVFRIFRPFLMPIFLAVILASLCYPGYRWILKLVKGRGNWASLISCLAITAIIIVPFVALVVQLAGQATQVYEQFRAAMDRGDFERMLNFKELPYVGALVGYADEYVNLEEIDLIGMLGGALQNVSSFFIRHSTAIVGGIAHLVTSFFIMLITMFFLFRDGSGLVEQFKAYTPLSPRYEGLIIDKFKEVTSATILGSLVTALAQGVAGGIVFWILGIPNVLLWGSLMALFSLVPLVGTSIIWIPWTIFLLVTGSFIKAIILVLASVLFVGMIDNVLRPLLIEGQMRMHSLLVFLSIMGGISYFGMIGLILGPIMVALGLTFLELYKIEYKVELAKPSDE